MMHQTQCSAWDSQALSPTAVCRGRAARWRCSTSRQGSAPQATNYDSDRNSNFRSPRFPGRRDERDGTDRSVTAGRGRSLRTPYQGVDADSTRNARSRDTGRGALRDADDERIQSQGSDDDDEWNGVDNEPRGRDDWQRPEQHTKQDILGEALYGVFPVLNALRSKRRRRIYTLYMLNTLNMAARKDAGSIRAVLSVAESSNVPVQEISRHELNLLSDYRQHQGLVLDCEPLGFQNMDQFPNASEVMVQGSPAPVWLVLDEVVDPQNFGAVLRSAWCLGVSGVLVSSKNCAPLSPAVSKASAGAMELAPVHATRGLQRTLTDAASRGWKILGAAGERGAVDSVMVSVTAPTILVVGNEGAGLRTNIRRVCQKLVRVQMSPMGFRNSQAGDTTQDQGRLGTQGQVDSLNVSVATGILLHDLLASASAPKQLDSVA